MSYTMSDRRTCTKEAPADNKPGDRWQHPDAISLEGTCDCCDRYRCPNCGLTFKVELPE